MMTGSKRTRTGVVRDRNFTAKGVSNSCFISELPDPVSHEIFFKLQIKDVMRCKCVCKEWNNVLSNLNFSRNYAKNSPFTSILRSMSPSLIDSVPNVSYLFEISENGDCSQAPFTPKLPGWLRKKWSLSFEGSCNGFVCMKVQKPGVEVIYITNPIMGDPVALPRRERDEAGNSLARYKFGFCPSVNKYKVLRIVFRYSKERKAQVLEIFTVGVDHMWRPLPDSFTGVSFLSVCAALNEAFHWLPMDGDLDFIRTFDLMEEKFGQIPLPPSLLPVPVPTNLAIFGNQLGVVDCSNPSQISIWKMKKYSVVESWNKVSVLRTWLPPTPITSEPVLVSTIELKNGDILFLYSSSDFISYNIEQKKCSKIEVDGHGRLFYHSIMTFTPNFSSPAELIMEGQRSMVNVQLE